MPTVNTLVVDRSDLLGLAQLYQLRGRVGRRGQRAYALPAASARPRPQRGGVRAAEDDRRVHRPRIRLQDRHARPRDPRRRQPAGRRAVRPHRRGRLRPLLPDGHRSSRRAQGRAGRRAGRHHHRPARRRQPAARLRGARRRADGGVPSSRRGHHHRTTSTTCVPSGKTGTDRRPRPRPRCSTWRDCASSACGSASGASRCSGERHGSSGLALRESQKVRLRRLAPKSVAKDNELVIPLAGKASEVAAALVALLEELIPVRARASLRDAMKRRLPLVLVSIVVVLCLVGASVAAVAAGAGFSPVAFSVYGTKVSQRDFDNELHQISEHPDGDAEGARRPGHVDATVRSPPKPRPPGSASASRSSCCATRPRHAARRHCRTASQGAPGTQRGARAGRAQRNRACRQSHANALLDFYAHRIALGLNDQTAYQSFISKAVRDGNITVDPRYANVRAQGPVPAVGCPAASSGRAGRRPMAGRVVAVGLGPAGADHVLPVARTALAGAATRFVRTRRHPAVVELEAEGMSGSRSTPSTTTPTDLGCGVRARSPATLVAARRARRGRVRGARQPCGRRAHGRAAAGGGGARRRRAGRRARACRSPISRGRTWVSIPSTAPHTSSTGVRSRPPSSRVRCSSRSATTRTCSPT